jgi:PKD repeat protein
MRSVSFFATLFLLLLMTTPAAAEFQNPEEAPGGWPILVSFTANDTTGTAPLAVQFTDQSTGNPGGWTWFFGDERFTDPWVRINASSGWTERARHGMVAVSANRLVLAGGSSQNDTWRSDDGGAHWLRVNASSGWSKRMDHGVVAVPDGRIVLMGGNANDVVCANDSWMSDDYGSHWTRMNASSGWSGRFTFGSAALPDGSIIVAGGYDCKTGQVKNDVWRSDNLGATWTRVNASAEWQPRSDLSMTATPDGTLVLMGGWDGNYLNDTWRSTDKGITWVLANASSGWEKRGYFPAVALPDNSVILIGGSAGSSVTYQDVWRSANKGTSWVRINATPGWQSRSGSGAAALPDGSIVISGGSWVDESHNYHFLNDTWRFAPAGSSAQNPVHVYQKGTWKASLQAYHGMGANSSRMSGYFQVSANPRDRIGVYRGSTHLFYLDYSGNGAWNGVPVDRQNNFGITGDLPVAGDWDSDGMTEIGVFRPSTHMFYLDYNGNGVWDGAVTDRRYVFGIAGDLPIAGDWTGDGRAEIGVFRPSTRQFYLDYNGNCAWDGAVTDRSYTFGITMDTPVVGDWDHDLASEIGVYRNSTHQFYLDYNGNGAWNGAVTDRRYDFGIAGDLPVTGDWMGDGGTGIGVFRPTTHLFYLDYNENDAWNGAVTDRRYDFGITGDSPVAGKWG